MKEKPKKQKPIGDAVTVPPFYWDDLADGQIDVICRLAGAVQLSDSRIQVQSFQRTILVDSTRRGIFALGKNCAVEKIDDPFLELMVLVYLLNVSEAPLADQLIGVRDLKDAHFFQGPHEFKVDGLIRRYANDPEGLARAGHRLGGKPVEQGDAAVVLCPFPKIPITVILWAGDDEFPPEVSILFDRSIEAHLSADAIWGLANYSVGKLVRTPDSKMG